MRRFRAGFALKAPLSDTAPAVRSDHRPGDAGEIDFASGDGQTEPDRDLFGIKLLIVPRQSCGSSPRLLLVVLALLAAPGKSAWAASPPPPESDRFMIVSAQHLAAEAGAEMLREGGNAIDAAVAAGTRKP